MKVYSLITVPRLDLLDSTTLVFDSFRTGFPTAKLNVTINAPLSAIQAVEPARKRIQKADPFTCNISFEPLHHADWMKETLVLHAGMYGDEPLAFLDGDTIFWKSVEDWKFETNLAGYYIPLIWNDFAKAPSFERLHTSFLWLQRPADLIEQIKHKYPPGFDATRAYSPVDPFGPRVQFIKGQPFFWDSTSVLYNMIGGTPFGNAHLEAFDHLNSASFYDVMYERLTNKAGFELLHKELVKTPDALRGMWWNVVNPYYAQKHEEALQYLATLSPAITKTLAPLLG
jgi:hypothetical protein